MKIDVEWIEKFLENRWRIGDYSIYESKSHDRVGVITYMPLIRRDFTTGMLMCRLELTYTQMNQDNGDTMFILGWRDLTQKLHKEVSKEMGFDEERKVLLQILKSRGEDITDEIKEAIEKSFAKLSDKDLLDVSEDFFKFQLV